MKVGKRKDSRRKGMMWGDRIVVIMLLSRHF